MKISPFNRRNKAYADGYTYPPHWTTKRIRRYMAFEKKNPQPRIGRGYSAWYNKLVRWMEKGGFK